jgi:hypothetical protein
MVELADLDRAPMTTLRRELPRQSTKDFPESFVFGVILGVIVLTQAAIQAKARPKHESRRKAASGG